MVWKEHQVGSSRPVPTTSWQCGFWQCSPRGDHLPFLTECWALCQAPFLMLFHGVRLRTQALESLGWVGDLVLALLALGRNDLDVLRYNNIMIIIMKGNIYIVLSMCQVLV